MQIQNTRDYPKVASIVMLVYGAGGVGKTTFAATFPKPLLLDFENGAKYFGERGIEVDVAVFKDWLTGTDKKELAGVLDKYETIIVDPIGEAMDKVINDTTAISGSKNRQSDGSLTAAGWGEAKKQMRNFVKWLRDSGKHVVLVAHVDEKADDETLVKRPLIATKLSDELITMVDVVGYMRVVDRDGETVRLIQVDGTDSKVISKDRTGKLGKYLKPEFDYLAEQLGARDNEQDDAGEEETPDTEEDTNEGEEPQEEAKKTPKKTISKKTVTKKK